LKLVISKANEAYIRVRCEPSEAYELRDYFTFDVPGAKFMPSFKSKAWDGKIRLYNTQTGLLFAGLRKYVERFCEERKYEFEHASDFAPVPFTVEEAHNYIKFLQFSGKLTMEPRDYQMDGFIHAIRERRTFLLSPTASGKSLIMYMIASLYCTKKCLIIVPTTGLVLQMKNDFIEYGMKEEDIHTIYSGQEKYSEQWITISTWQSIHRLPKAWFVKYGLVLGDEAHGFKAACLKSIMTKLDQCEYRVGVSGTLDGTKTNKLVLEGLFGPVYTVTTMKELMDAGHVSNLKIKCVVLRYPMEIRKEVKKLKTYGKEVAALLLTIPARNRFIKNLALSLKNNTLVLFRLRQHGRHLYNLIKGEAGNRNVYFVDGLVETEERERIRQIVETEDDAIIVASMGTFKMGVNINKLFNIIFAHPSKGRIPILQSIGRTLRLSEDKDYATLFDIADDMSIGHWKNFCFQHFIERVKIYIEERFSYTISNIDLKVTNDQADLLKQ
jgi:superfamily II DNA or RNA helicase